MGNLNLEELDHIRAVNEFFIRNQDAERYLLMVETGRTATRVANELRQLDYTVSSQKLSICTQLTVSIKNNY